MKSIVVKIKALAASERRITAEILDCIREIEAQRIHFEMGYPGLLEFLVQECGYSESAAFRRIHAARLTAQVPGLREDLQRGSLTLTQVSTAARGFRQKEKLGKKLSLEEKAEVLSALKNKSSFESQQITAKLLELPVVKQEKIMPQSDESVRLEMTLNKEEMELVQRAREILGHVSPGISWKELFVFMARDLIKRRDPAREVRAKAQKPRLGQGQGQDTNQNRNRNQVQNQNQSQRQRQRQNPNEIQEQCPGDEFLVKLPGLNSEKGNFDNITKIPLASPNLASAQLVLSSGLHSRASAPELAPSPKLTPSPAKTPTLEQRSSATLARWVNLSSPTLGAQIQGGNLHGSELVEAELLRAELPGAEMVEAEGLGSELSEAEQLGVEQPRVDPSGAEEIRFSSKSATPATSSSTLVASAHSTSTVPASLRRLVFRRDQRCQWLDHFTGRKCGSRHLLELDHIQSRWVGGLDEPSNLRLLCRAHNNLKYRLEARIRARSARTESL